MNIPLETLQELLGYHYDRREQVYRFLEALKPEEFVRDMNVGHVSIRSTLIHCLRAEEFWLQYAIQKGGRPSNNFADYPDVAAVRAEAQRVRGQTKLFVSTLTEDDLGREESVTYSSGTVVRFTLGKAFLHVITHDTHHRGQVMVLARQLGYQPPDIDLM